MDQPADRLQPRIDRHSLVLRLRGRPDRDGQHVLGPADELRRLADDALAVVERVVLPAVRGVALCLQYPAQPADLPRVLPLVPERMGQRVGRARVAAVLGT